MDRLVNMTNSAQIGRLLEVVEGSQSADAMRGLALLVAQAGAGQQLSSDVASMVTDLFGGSNPRKVAEAARGALAYYSITCNLGLGADLLRSGQNDAETPPPPAWA